MSVFDVTPIFITRLRLDSGERITGGRTTAGSRGAAIDSRSSTSCRAVIRSVPSWKIRTTDDSPRTDFDRRVFSPVVPLSAFSSGTLTRLSTSSVDSPAPRSGSRPAAGRTRGRRPAAPICAAADAVDHQDDRRRQDEHAEAERGGHEPVHEGPSSESSIVRPLPGIEQHHSGDRRSPEPLQAIQRPSGPGRSVDPARLGPPAPTDRRRTTAAASTDDRAGVDRAAAIRHQVRPILQVRSTEPRQRPRRPASTSGPAPKATARSRPTDARLAGDPPDRTGLRPPEPRKARSGPRASIRTTRTDRRRWPARARSIERLGPGTPDRRRRRPGSSPSAARRRAGDRSRIGPGPVGHGSRPRPRLRRGRPRGPGRSSFSSSYSSGCFFLSWTGFSKKASVATAKNSAGSVAP